MYRPCWVLAFAMLLGPGAGSVSAQQAGHPAKASSESHDGLIRMLSMGASKSITFSDENGRPISEAAFLAGLKRTGSFKHKRDEASQSTAFTLMPGHEAKVMVKKGASLEQALHVHFRVAPGQRFPAFHLAEVHGQTVSNASLRGTPTVVNFFFADCIGCIAETPALNAYAKAHPHVRVLAVTYDDQKTAAQYVSKRDFVWPVAYGGQSLMDALGVKVYPAIALMGADGRLLDLRLSASIQTGGDAITAQDLDHWVKLTLAKGAVAPTR